ncbi:type I-E CRISPR-associated protein Cse2/CasB [Janthinobacterium agaricidamnosum]|uniref:CRISPR-associated Cse2 family protein n=1 Tax=Janthinobacterium agaricidamnosum NBRC 102515 = DSM 9628 TaxID=1349767 RepID=W0V7E4_9BURK|nr:type I-E CRISPR-associated protein Cse2/CasB [Janthinobacterium agaricidamnosum]CDG83801.1 CRISPR-associated Cse2 family protein [Janthinobacterium agaricidamnosum NBRC 102515 = DSM 9628]
MQEKENLLSEHFFETLKEWWSTLDETGNGRASRAILRRCATLDEVVLSPAYQQFYRYLLACKAWPEDASSWKNDKLAAIAGLLVHVKKTDDERLPVTMSQLDGDKPLVSELRFRNLLRVETTDEVYRGLRSVLPLIKHQAHIKHLVNDVYWWSDQTRKKWAYAYRWPAKQST